MSETITAYKDFDTELESLEIEEDVQAEDDSDDAGGPRLPGYNAKKFRTLAESYKDQANQIAAYVRSQRDSFLDWHQSAVCSYIEDKDIFFSGPEGSSKKLREQNEKFAIAICGLCLVREQCLQEGLEYEDQYSIRAGKSAADMKNLVRRKRRTGK